MLDLDDLETIGDEINVSNVLNDNTGVVFEEDNKVTTDKVKRFRTQLFYVEVPNVCLYSDAYLRDVGVIQETNVNKITGGALALTGGYTVASTGQMEYNNSATHQINSNGIYEIRPGRLPGENAHKINNVYQGDYVGGNNNVLSELGNARKGKATNTDMHLKKVYKNIDEIIDIHSSGYSINIINSMDINIIYNFVYDIVNNDLDLPNMSPNIQLAETEKFNAYRDRILAFTQAVYAQNKSSIDGDFDNNIWELHGDMSFNNSIENAYNEPVVEDKVEVVQDGERISFGNVGIGDDFLNN